jgi:hypothetical protein
MADCRLYMADCIHPDSTDFYAGMYILYTHTKSEMKKVDPFDQIFCKLDASGER